MRIKNEFNMNFNTWKPFTTLNNKTLYLELENLREDQTGTVGV